MYRVHCVHNMYYIVKALNTIFQGTDAAIGDVVDFVLDTHFGGGNLTESAVTKEYYY